MPFRGRWLSHGENDYTGFLYAKDPVTCPKERIDYALLPAVGGKTLTWAAISWRFGERDFQNRGIGDDWPFGYRELEPYYSRAELFMGDGGSRAGFPRDHPGLQLHLYVWSLGQPDLHAEWVRLHRDHLQ
jgi:choline dehydrogenase-like flavoprotein